MSQPAIINPGAVAWSGENPGLYLREQAEGPWTALASFFRVMLSPHGPGHAAVVMLDPTGPGTAERPNLCLTDNEPLARYLIDEFVRHFGAFKGAADLDGLALQAAGEFRHEGDGHSGWREIVRGSGLELVLEWEELEPPYLVAAPAASTPTGRHDLYTVFSNARVGRLRLNGVAAPGRPFPRDSFGRVGSTAFLAFAETWVTQDEG